MSRLHAMRNFGKMLTFESDTVFLGEAWNKFDIDTQAKIAETLPKLVQTHGSFRCPQVTEEMYKKFGVEKEEIEKLWLALHYASDCSNQLDNLCTLRKELLLEFELHEELLEARHRILHMMDKTINSTLKRYTSFIGPNYEGNPFDCLCGLPLKAPHRDPFEKNIDRALAEWNIYREDVPMHHFDELVDLIFVGIISSMSYAFTHSVKKESYFKQCEKAMDIVAVFFAAYVLFICHTVSVIRFTYGAKWNTDICHAVYGLGLIIVAFVEKDSLSRKPTHIVAGLSLCIASLLAIHILFLAKKTVRGLRYIQTRIITFSISCCLLLLCFIPSNVPFVNAFLVIIAFVPPLIVELNSFRVEPSHPPVTVEHLCERFGMFSVFCLGESILATMNAFDGSLQHVMIMASNFVIAFLVYKEVFTFWKQRVERHCHALFNPKPLGSCLWVFLHLPLGLFLAFNGFAYMLVMKGKTETGIWYMMFFIPLVFLTLQSMRVCHISVEFRPSSYMFITTWAISFLFIFFLFEPFFVEFPLVYCWICSGLVFVYHQFHFLQIEREEDFDEDETDTESQYTNHLYVPPTKEKGRIATWRNDLQNDTQSIQEKVIALSPRVNRMHHLFPSQWEGHEAETGYGDDIDSPRRPSFEIGLKVAQVGHEIFDDRYQSSMSQLSDYGDEESWSSTSRSRYQDFKRSHFHPRNDGSY